MKIFQFVGKLLFLLFMLSANIPIYAQVVPTDQWVNFYSNNTIYQGGAVPIGAVIDAYDPDGVHCGTFTVKTEGHYGFLIVYRDDALTENVDEGAMSGDTITFKINGIKVKALGPDTNVWTENGDIFETDLADNLSPAIIASIADIVMLEDAPDLIIADLDTVFFDPENDPLIFSAASNSSGVQTIIDVEHRVAILLAPNWSGKAVLIISAQDAWFTVHDTVFVEVMEINDPPVIHEIPDTSFSSDATLTIDLNKYVEDADHPKSSLSWIAEIKPPYENALSVKIDDAAKVAVFSANYFFSANVEVIFIVTDDSLDSDRDTMFVQVDLPEAVDENENFNRPKTYSLSHNYPNPFNSATSISYQLSEYCHVTIKVINSLGQEVAILIDKKQNAGYYTIYWDASEQTSGVYLMSFETSNFKQLQKMILLR